MMQYENEDMDLEVGSTIKDENGDNLVISRIIEEDNYFDLEVINIETRKQGSLRLTKSKKI